MKFTQNLAIQKRRSSASIIMEEGTKIVASWINSAQRLSFHGSAIEL